MLALLRFPARFTRAVFTMWMCTLLGASAHAATPSPLVLDGLGRASLPVDGPWQFHEGDDLAWASPAYDDSAWQPIQAGRTWEEQGHRGLTGFAWYRKRLSIAPGETANWTLALYLPSVDSACEVYWNGVKVGSYGRVPPRPVWYVETNGRVIALGQPQSGELAIRVWKAPIVFLNAINEGGLVAIPRVGSVEAMAAFEIEARYRRTEAAKFSLSVARICAIVGLLALLLFLRNRNQPMLMWLSLSMFMPLMSYLLLAVPEPHTFRVFYGIIGPLNATNDLAIWFSLIALLGLHENKRLVRWTWIIALTAIALDLVDSVCMLLDWTTWPANRFLTIDVATSIPAIYMELWGLVLVFAALGKPLDAARWILALTALLRDLLTAAADVTGLGERWTHWTIDEHLNAALFTIDGYSINAQSLANTFLLIAILYAAWRYSVEQSQRQGVLEQEYRSAQELQQVLIPESMPALPGCVVKAVYRPAQEVGGDFFQVIPLHGDAALVVIGDVSGKGLHAAMTVALIVGAIRSIVEMTQAPANILSALNRRLYGRLQRGFATCLVLRIENSGECVLANAGHLPPFLDVREVQLPPALPLGIVEGAEYETVRILLSETDRLTLYTDGLLEARNAEGELFGFARIAELLAATTDAEKIADAAQQFGQDDDITVLTLSRAVALVEVPVQSAQWGRTPAAVSLP
jgi:hypothetical protein